MFKGNSTIHFNCSITGAHQLPEFEEDYVMHVQDFHSKESNLIYTSFIAGLGPYFNQDYNDLTAQCFEAQHAYPDQSDMGAVPFQGGLINDRGNFFT